MVKNWEIIREILLRLENANTPNVYLNANSIREFPEQEVAYNMRLLADAQCIDARFVNSSLGNRKIGSATAIRLTNAGHELLDTIRNETVWGKIKEKFKSVGIDMTIGLVLDVGKKVIEGMLS